MILKNHQYTDTIKHQRVLLVGVFPLPLGGISVHLQRVQARLVAQGCQVWAWDVCKRPVGQGQLGYYMSLWLFCLKQRPQVLIYHTMQLRRYPIELLILLLAGKWLRSQTLVMIHSGRFVARLSWLSRKLTGYLLGYYDQLIVVSVALGQELITQFSLTGKPVKISIESPFLAPDCATGPQILKQIPNDLQLFRQQHRPLISCAITRKEVWQGGDLYGLDLILAAFKLLKQDWAQAGLLVMISDQTGYEPLEKIPGVYYLLDFAQEIWPLIGESDLFIRPTRSDSFGISVMEALSLRVPVVASDVCVRPPGAVLFKAGDAQDLYIKIKQVLS